MKIAKLRGKPEIFYTIQGEGKSIGQPSVFVRSSLCNLSCVWCDTDYTWNWEGTPFKHKRDSEPGYRKFKQQEQIIEMTPEQIAEEVLQYPCKNLVLTGGEPLLQQKGWIAVMALLRQKAPDYWFEVETNCTVVPEKEFDALINQYNVAPKTENSGNRESLREKPSVYRFYAGSPKAVFKYVIAEKQDLDETLELIQKYEIQHSRVFLVAEGVTTEELGQKQSWIMEACRKHGFCFSDRLHIQRYGNKRGV